MGYKNYFLILLLAFSTLGYSQYVPSKPEYYAKYKKPLEDAGSLYAQIGAGLSLPMGTWGEAPSPNLPLLAPFLGDDGMGAGIGYFVNFSQMVPINAFSTKSNSYWGIKWGAEFASHGWADWSEAIPEATSQADAYNFSLLLGPTYTFRLGEKAAFELGGTVNFSLFSGQTEITTVASIDPSEYDFMILPATPESGSEIGWQPGFSFSLGFRIHSWKLYGEYYTQGINRYYEVTTYDLQEEVIQGFNGEYNISTLRIGIAWLFGNV